MNINYVNLAGNIGAIELKKSKTDNDYIVITLATNKFSTNKDSKKTQITYWHTLYIYDDKKIEYAKKLVKGDNIVIYGELAYSTWESEEGKHNKSSFVVVKSFNKVETLANKMENVNANEEPSF